MSIECSLVDLALSISLQLLAGIRVNETSITIGRDGRAQRWSIFLELDCFMYLPTLRNSLRTDNDR